MLKAKNIKDNWIYAPSLGAAKEDAAFKIVGAECAGQCKWSVLELDGYEVQAFLSRPDAEVSRISGIGHFVSVDGRPVATTRSTFKKIITKYRSHLRAAAEELDGVKDPFAWINVSCPRGSYDPNIEPAKNDVLFEDADKVLNVVDSLLKQCYPGTAKTTKADKVHASNDLGNDNIVHERRSAKRQKTSHNMTSEGSDEPVLFDALEERPSEALSEVNNSDATQDLRHINVSNPWIMAKMNAPVRVRQHVSGPNGQLPTPMQERSSKNMAIPPESETMQLPPHPPWTLPSLRFSPIRSRRQQAQRVEPTTDEPCLLDIGPDNSVSVVNQEYDDIDPSLADRYKATKWKRYIGWQRSSDTSHENEHLVSEETAPRYLPHQSLSLRKPRVATDDGTHDTVSTPSTLQAGIGLSKRRPNATKQEGARIMDIRDAFAVGILNGLAQANTARKFKPFKPLLSATRVLELPDANSRLMADFERYQTLLSDAGSWGAVDNPRSLLHLEQPDISSHRNPEDSSHTDTNDTPDLTRSARRPQRTVLRTSHLALEQIPLGQQINGLVRYLHVSIESLSKLTRIAYATQPTVVQYSNGRVNYSAGYEPWDTPRAETLGSDDSTLESGQNAMLESTLLYPEVGKDEITDWRESIFEYLETRGELEDGVSESMLNSHLQAGLDSTMGEYATIFEEVGAR